MGTAAEQTSSQSFPCKLPSEFAPIVPKSHSVYYWWLVFPLTKLGLSLYHPNPAWVSSFKTPFGVQPLYSLEDVCGSRL